MTDYVYTTHSITDATKLQTELVSAGEVAPEFAINTDVYIRTTRLNQTQANAVIVAAAT